MSRPPVHSRKADADQRGSVLIFVVGVLLLLAIVATAFLGTSRSDRTATQQNAYNTQIDLLFDGVVETLKGEIASDARYLANANTYDAYSASSSADADEFLAARIPTLFDTRPSPPALPPGAGVAPGDNPPMWRAITKPILDSAFSFPITVPGNPTATYATRQNLQPTSVVGTDGQTYPAFVLNFNDLTAGNYPLNDYVPTAYAVPAMDTDQDGIADAGMVKVPVGPIAGVTYYYGARIVDMGSAINVNTAWMANDPNPTPALAAGEYRMEANFFPSNVDLLGLLTGPNAAAQQTQMGDLNIYRTNGLGTFNLTPVDDNGVARADFTFAATNTTSTDALWNQLGRRTENPGRNTAGAGGLAYRAFDVSTTAALASQFVIQPSASSTTALDKALPLSLLPTGKANKPYNPSAALLWYTDNFDFPTATASPPQTMPLRALLTAASPSGTDDPKSAGQSMPSSGSVEVWDPTKTSYSFGDVVSYAPAGPSIRRNFVCLMTHAPSSANSPGTAAGIQYWSLVGWSNQSQKVAVNTADFGELWWGFRRVMAASLDLSPGVGPHLSLAPFPTPANTSVLPYYASMNGSSVTGPYAVGDKARQFRTPLRDPLMTADQFSNAGAPPAGTRSLSPSEMLQVRTAIAAVNAMDIRDADSNITARQIVTYNYGTTPPTALHSVTVFGSEIQPYITEVYVNNDNENNTPPGPNPYGYVAIELYNPYPIPLNLSGWSLGLINRSNPTVWPRTIAPVLAAPNFPTQKFELADNIIVPPNGYLILENHYDAATAPAASPPLVDAPHRPPEVDAAIPGTAQNANTITSSTTIAPGSVYYKYVAGLGQALAGYNGVGTGGEVMLLRPRIWDPSGISPLPANSTTVPETAEDPHAEVGTGTNIVNLSDWVPIDSFDFFGMNGTPAVGDYHAWHYVRPNSIATGDAWKWVHAGPYNNQAAAGTVRQGLTSNSFASPGPPTFPNLPPPAPLNTLAPPVLIGMPKTSASFFDVHLGTQINNEDWPSVHGANVSTGAVNNKTPFGAFTQQTDLFRIPYIGAYTVRTYGTTDTTVLVPPAPAPRGFTEMNALPIDFSFADDQDEGVIPTPTPPDDNAVEQVGRFCPLNTLDPYTYRNWPIVGPASPPDWYDFSYFADNRVPRTLFDVFTTQSPLDDGLPNVSADEYALALAPGALMPMAVNNANSSKPAGVTYATVQSSTGTQVTLQASLSTTKADLYAGTILQVISGASRGQMTAVTASTAPPPPMMPVLDINPTLALTAGDKVRVLATPEDTAGTQGLININTAPWPVLARLPLALFSAPPAQAGKVDPVTSEIIAKRIVTYRDGDPSANGLVGPAGLNLRTGHGPFKSIMDLNKVLSVAASANPAPGTAPADAAFFQTAGGTLALATTDYPGIRYGDITPLPVPFPAGAVTPDNVIGDFENRYLVLSRVSNLITTRSDAFVVYVSLQGWRDAGTANAKMVTQRRAAFIVDRSGVTETSPTPKSTRVPAN